MTPLRAVGIAGFALPYSDEANRVSLITGIGTDAILTGSLTVILRHHVPTQTHPQPNTSQNTNPKIPPPKHQRHSRIPTR